MHPIALSTILGPDYHCAVCPGLKLPMSVLERGIILVSGRKASDRVKCLSLSRKTIARTTSQLAPQVTVNDAAGVIRLMDSPLVRLTYRTMRSVTSKFRWVRVNVVKMNVPTKVRIVIEDLQVKLKAVENQEENRVKFHVLKHGSSKEFKKKVLMYVHGGAFVGPTAAALDDFYVKEWAGNLKGLTILSTDHSPGPEFPFPVALQQVLDTWLWLNSGSQSVEQKIGFIPEEIVLTGDSSGGSIVSSLLVILNELRNLPALQADPIFPKSVVLLFPKTTLQFDLFPSLMLSVFDSILNMQLLLGACVAYMPMKKRDENGNWHLVQDNQTIPPDFIVQDEYAVIESPILSPLRYKKLDQLSTGLSLHLLAIANDPLLDEAVELARKWKGSCQLHVVEGVYHGAFIYNYFSREGSKCVPLTTDMFRRAFQE